MQKNIRAQRNMERIMGTELINCHAVEQGGQQNSETKMLIIMIL